MHVRKKIGKIVEELTMYFFAVGAKQIDSRIVENNRIFEIMFSANYDHGFDENLKSLDKYLNEPKNEGIEDIYWELAGSGDPGETSQLLLIGMMIDKAEIFHGENCVKVILTKELLD